MRRGPLTISTLVAVAFAVAVGGCQDDPQYVQLPVGLDGDPDAEDGVTLSLTLPIELESADDARDRAALATELAMPADQVPYVRVDDLDVAVEYTITNNGTEAGQAFVAINGGNQYFFYVPADFAIDPEEDEVPPPLMGGFPIEVPAGGQVSDVIREDEVREASIDLELITRGGLHPLAALLTVHEDLDVFQPVAPIDPEDPGQGTMPVGMPISVRAFGQIVRFDVVFEAPAGMHLDVALRVRDHRDIVHRRGLDAPAGELTAFAPAQYAPPGGEPAPMPITTTAATR